MQCVIGEYVQRFQTLFQQNKVNVSYRKTVRIIARNPLVHTLLKPYLDQHVLHLIWIRTFCNGITRANAIVQPSLSFDIRIRLSLCFLISEEDKYLEQTLDINCRRTNGGHRGQRLPLSLARAQPVLTIKSREVGSIV